MAAPASPNSRLHDELVGHVTSDRALFVVGTGISIGATGNAPTAGWVGLISDGLSYCEELTPNEGLKKRHAPMLQDRSVGADELVMVASLVEKRLGGSNRRGGPWRNWLRKAIGHLRVSDRSLVDLLHTLGRGKLATCNYDDVLTGPDYPAVPWTNAATVVRVLSGEERGVVHLHGHWATPESVVLGFSSYSDLLRDEAAQSLQRSLASLSSLVFVGFGAGLEDPNFGELLAWMSKTFAEREAHHFWLVRERDLERAHSALPEGCRVVVLSYGPDFSDLQPFLADLVTRAGVKKVATDQDVFVGRRAEIEGFNARLARWLATPPEQWCVAIDGLGGAGKTSLAEVLLKEAIKSGVRVVRLLEKDIKVVSESRELQTLQRLIATGVSEVTQTQFARFAAVKAGAASRDRSAAWHDDLNTAMAAGGGARLAILLDDYERISRFPRGGSAQVTRPEADDNLFCHAWVRDAIVRSAPSGVFWILAGRGCTYLDLPKGAQVFQVPGLERAAVFKLVKASGSTDPLGDTDRLMIVTSGHALAIRVALRGKGFPDTEDGHESLSESDAEVVVRTLRYLWLEQEAGSRAASEREAVVGLALTGGLPEAVADKVLGAAGSSGHEAIASQLHKTFPELFEAPGALDMQVASSLMRTLEARRWPNVDLARIAARLSEALRAIDRGNLGDDERFEMDAAEVSLASWLSPQEGTTALSRFLLRAHVSTPGLRRGIAVLQGRAPVRKIAGWRELSQPLPAERVLAILRHSTREPNLKKLLDMAYDALRFEAASPGLDVCALPVEMAERALNAEDPLAREVGGHWLGALAALAFARSERTRAMELWSILQRSGPTPAARERALGGLAMCAAHDARPTEAKRILGDRASAGVWGRVTEAAERAKERNLRRARSYIQSREPERAHQLVLGMVAEYPEDRAVLERLVHTARRTDSDGPVVPDDPVHLTSVRSTIYYGELALRNGELAKAELFFLVSERRASELLRRDATRANRTLLANATSRLAETALYRGQLEEAGRYLDKRIAHGEALAAGMDPDRESHAKAQTKHARARSGFIRLLLNDRLGATARFEEALSLDATYFHAQLGRALCGVDERTSISTALRDAQVSARDQILPLDLALLACLAGDAPGQLPQRPRDSGRLLLFALRVEAAARSSLTSDSLRSLRATVCGWLNPCPTWFGEDASSST